MVARVPVPLASLEEEGQTPAPAGDHQGRPYGLSGFLPVFRASVDAYWTILAAISPSCERELLERLLLLRQLYRFFSGVLRVPTLLSKAWVHPRRSHVG
jgi:hypothetical protein